MNQWNIIGNLGKEPDMSYSPNGVPVTKFSVAISEWDFQQKARTTLWVNVVCFNKVAERVNQYLHKGSKVLCTGRMSQKQYTDKDGQKKYWTELVAQEVEFLSPMAAQERSTDPDTMPSDILGDLDLANPF